MPNTHGTPTPTLARFEALLHESEHLAARKPKRMQFTASPDFYQLADDATALDVTDQIHARQRQLEALLMATTINEGGEEGFYGALSLSQQADYMSACHSLAVEIGELTKMLADMARGEES